MTNMGMPVKGCWVSQKLVNGDIRTGIVRQCFLDSEIKKVRVQWHHSGEESVVETLDLKSAFKVGMDVMLEFSDDIYEFGEGTIIALRTIASVDQCLVEFFESEEKRWLPYFQLRQIKGVKHAFSVGSIGSEEPSERMRLKTLAHAIVNWNENTGALSSLEIDPLPHQIHLVHHILSSGNLNWLIADDVGLGKTIETGMLLYALNQRGLAKRILLITPSGLTKQWQEEMHDKFGLGDFEIYNKDFFINETRQWKMHDHVIGSMDILKQPEHLESLLSAEPWDLVVVDEAHRLSRRQYGMKYEASDRFDLASKLRKTGKARSMVLLSATPHQGMQDKFIALLELLRPERRKDLHLLSIRPELLTDMVYRNYKADVTDAEGNFVFHGKTVLAVPMQVSEESDLFDIALRDYLKKGYSASEKQSQSGNAIGFVMTIYRKLAASSSHAIYTALQRRRDRLLQHLPIFQSNTSDYDERYTGEYDEVQILSNENSTQFFDGELELLDELICNASKLRDNDQKLKGFLVAIQEHLLRQNINEKILIFTEYRSTQTYLENALKNFFGNKQIVLLHGGMSHDERRASIDSFEHEAQFLISTEAGGEGINLQRHCHVMANFDLPWNPMRLVQRIGRLYRYGQKRKVIVLNIHSPGSADEQIIQMMYQRIDQVVTDMAAVESNEFNEAMKDDIFGELANLVDLESILEDAASTGLERTKERIDEALRKAKSAASLQNDLFKYVAGFDPNELKDQLVISEQHIVSFILGMFKQLNIELEKTMFDGKLLRIKLPDSVMEQLGTRKSFLEITTDRILARSRSQQSTVMMDMNAPLMKYLIKVAKSYAFGGKTAVITDNLLSGDAFFTANLRWQDKYGRRIKQEFSAFFANNKGVLLNPKVLEKWLLQNAVSVNSDDIKDRIINQKTLHAASETAETSLNQHSNNQVFPDHIDWVSAAWIR